MAKQSKITWKTESRLISDLIQSEINPRKISTEQKEALQRSLEKFNLADIPVLNNDNTIISGNQRIKILAELGKGSEKIDVRVPNRNLTETELKEYMLIANTHAGRFDVDLLDAEFEDISIEFEIAFVEDVEAPSRKISILDDNTLDEKLQNFKEGTRKALQIEFEQDDYLIAYNLVKYCREKELNIGKYLIEKLTEIKNKSEKKFESNVGNLDITV